MTTEPPPPPVLRDPGDAGKRSWVPIAIVIAVAVAVGVLLGVDLEREGSEGYAVAAVAYLAVIAVPVVALVAGIRRARRHPGAGGREFLAGCFLVLALELGVLVIVVGAFLVAARTASREV